MNPVSPERWHQIDKILKQLFDLPPGQRIPFLEQHCQDDPALYHQLKSVPAANQTDHLVLDALDSRHLAALLQDLSADDFVPVVEGHRIGPYALVAPIARGGMGEVFLAERADGSFDQQVALKLVRRGRDSKAVHRRFVAERQILARLRHEHIARLLDGGVSEEGRPYFVMEYIDGVPLTKYCDKRQLSVDARLELFADVCKAVQYAHRSLVVHRDLKPSNILVTEAGKVKLLDFGIAKVLEEDEDAEATVLTRTGMQVMTPQYAAPEQVQGEAITTATDVYALGVILYELLTGHRPYQVQGWSPAELVRVICETEPSAPSTVVVRTAERHRRAGRPETITPEMVSRARGIQTDRLRRRLQGDLDTMVLKALRKEPDRRYASAEAFLEDVRRHLAGLPVQAQRDTVGYRMRKFVVRNGVSVGATVLVLLLVSMLVGFYTMRLAQERDRAQVEAAKSERVRAFVVGLFEVSGPEEMEDRDITARELLSRGVEEIEALAKEPEVQAEMLQVLGVVHRELGYYEEAQPLLEQSLALRREVFGEEHVDVAKSMYELANLLDDVGAYDKAEQLNREALEICRRLLGDKHEDVAEILNNLSLVLWRKGIYDEAERLQRESLEMSRKLFGDEHEDVAESLNNLGLILLHKGVYGEAERLQRESLEMSRKLLGNEHPDVVASLNNLAVVLEKKGNYDEAEKLHREALQLRRKLLGNEHKRVAIDLDNLALVLQKKGGYEEAEQLNREALAMFRKLLGDEHLDVAISLSNLGSLFYKKGDFGEAERQFNAALAMYHRVLNPKHPLLATVLDELGRLQLELGRPIQADSLLRQALGIRQASFGDMDRRTAETKMQLGRCQTAQARYAEAEDLLLGSLTVLQDKHKEEVIQEARQALVDLYTAWGKPEQAAAYRDERP